MKKYEIIIDKTRPYESACEILKQNPLTLNDFSFLPEDDQQYMHSMHRVTTVIKAQKQSRQFNWNNYGERKYYPWWDMETYGDAPAGSGFSSDGYGAANTGTTVGARLSNFSPEETRFIAEAMPDDYRVIMKG